jgi:hypothetical protein
MNSIQSMEKMLQIDKIAAGNATNLWEAIVGMLTPT